MAGIEAVLTRGGDVDFRRGVYPAGRSAPMGGSGLLDYHRFCF